MISVYDINDAVEETHRVVETLGFKAVFLRSNIINGKLWHDPYYEPLWATLERLKLPSASIRLRLRVCRNYADPGLARPPGYSGCTASRLDRCLQWEVFWAGVFSNGMLNSKSRFLRPIVLGSYGCSGDSMKPTSLRAISTCVI